MGNLEQAGPHERPTMSLESWNLDQPNPQEEGLEIKFNHVANDLINPAYVMKPQ